MIRWAMVTGPVIGRHSPALAHWYGAAAGASETARKALGFEELLTGDVEAMQRRTRNYARRQLTWMRKLADVSVLDVTDLSAEQVAERIAALAR